MNKHHQSPINQVMDASDRLAREFKGISLSGFRKVLFLIYNTIPMFHLLVIVSIWVLVKTVFMKILLCGCLLYLLPPIIARIVLCFCPCTKKIIRTDEKEFLAWWLVLNLQGLFSRLSFLEELLRIIPGLYSAWLRLWGSKIGRLTYWAAGTRILDRSFLNIGDDVVFGAGVRLNSHVLQKTKMGEVVLVLDDVDIGDRAIIGGYSLLTAGTIISNYECTRAFTISPPFSKWKNGKRQKLSKDDF